VNTVPVSSPYGDGFAAEKIIRIIEQQTFAEDRTTASLQALIKALGFATQPERAIGRVGFSPRGSSDPQATFQTGACNTSLT
jgi:hypothetical protein